MLGLTKKEANASDEACEDKNTKFVGTSGLTNHPATCPGVKSRKLFSQREPQAQQKFSPETRVMETRYFNFHCKRVLQNGAAVDCPWLICSASKIKSAAATANVLSLDVQPHFTQYLLRGGILVTHELITALSIEVSAGEAKLGGMPKTSLFHINDFKQYDLMPYQKFLQTPLSGAPQKYFQLGPALAKAGLG